MGAGFDPLAGSQARFIELPDPAAAMAAEAGMSACTFRRRFAETTNEAPGETARPPVEKIATQAGFGSLQALRHPVRRRIGVPPREYCAGFG